MTINCQSTRLKISSCPVCMLTVVILKENSIHRATLLLPSVKMQTNLWNCLLSNPYVYPGVKLGRILPDRRSGTSYLRSTTSNNRSCTPQLRSGTFLLGSTLCTVYFWVFFCVRIMFCKKCSPSRSFCHLHLSTLCVDRCCKRKTLIKCHKS